MQLLQSLLRKLVEIHSFHTSIFEFIANFRCKSNKNNSYRQTKSKLFAEKFFILILLSIKSSQKFQFYSFFVEKCTVRYVFSCFFPLQIYIIYFIVPNFFALFYNERLKNNILTFHTATIIPKIVSFRKFSKSRRMSVMI